MRISDWSSDVCSSDLSAAGFALGAATALIGPEAAMACTAAIETEIDRHYTEQLEELGGEDPELGAAIREFRDDEREHRDTRSEERRVGKECVSRCRSRGSTDHEQKKQKKDNNI